MREILFRGKNVDSGEWVYGGYSLYPHTRFPCKPTIYEVDSGCWNPVEIVPDTLGQYTGLNDKNGKRIFEGDIIRYHEAVGSVRFGTYPSAYESRNTHAGFYIEWHIDRMLRIDLAFWANERGVEVIGNIHDNPEMLEVQHD